MDTFDQLMWLPFVVITCINVVTFWLRAKPRIAGDAALYQRFKRFMIGFVIVMNLPWLVLGIVSLFGGISMFDILSRPHTNLYFWLFDASVIVAWIVTIISIYFRDGAEMLSYSAPKGVQGFLYSPTMIKIWVALMLAGGVFGLIGILNMTGTF